MTTELPVEKLRRRSEPTQMRCETTKELTPLEGIIGQERAAKALKFGLDIDERGFNIYVAGLPGTGKKTAVKDFLEEVARGQPVPPDCCYVNNFRNSYEPKAVRLPPGRGREFQAAMQNLVGEVRGLLPKAFESEDYASKREAKIGGIEKEKKELLTRLNKRAQEEGFVLRSTPIGVLIIPVMKGKPLSDQEVTALPQQEKEELLAKREKLRLELRNAMRQLRGLEKRVDEEIQKLNREVAIYAIGHLINGLVENYEEFPDVKA